METEPPPTTETDRSDSGIQQDPTVEQDAGEESSRERRAINEPPEEVRQQLPGLADDSEREIDRETAQANTELERPAVDADSSGMADTALDRPSVSPESSEEEVERRTQPESPPGPAGDTGSGSEAPDEPDPDRIASDLHTLSIDDWLDEEDDDEPFEEPFPLEDVIEDRGESGQERVQKPAVEIIRVGEAQPLDVSVLRGRQSWSADGEPLEVECRGDKAILRVKPPGSGWLARANSPAERKPISEPPIETQLAPGDVAEISDGDVTYRVRFFHPPKTPSHVEREDFGRSVAFYAAAVAAAVVIHALGALGIITLHYSFGVALSIKDKPKKEKFATGKLEEPKEKKEEKKEKKKPKPPKPEPKPVDPSEQKAKVPKSVEKELNKRLEKKRKASENKSKADALAAAFKGDSSDSKDSVKEAVSNIDAVESPSGSSSLKVGGKLEAAEGNEVKITTGDGNSSLGDIGSKIKESTGSLKEREDKKEKVRAQVDKVESQASVEGSLARSKVLKVINQHMGKIQGCYEQELLSNAGLSGKVTLEWTVTRSGGVSGVREKSSTLGSAAVSNCIMGIVRGMSFPKPKGGAVSISFPFVFRSG